MAVILSPLLIWGGQSQHSQRDFLQSKVVSPDAVQSGFVSVSGSPLVETTLNCPQINAADIVKSCLYVGQEIFEYKTIASTLCGTSAPSSDYRIIKQVENRCDEYGNSCEQCYQVEKDDWTSLDKKNEYAQFKIGAFTIVPSNKANYVDELTGEYVIGFDGVRRGAEEKPVLGDKEYKFVYFPVPETVLVSGTALDEKIDGTGDGLFVISSKGREATAAALKTEDKMKGRFFSALSLLLMAFGFMLMASPLTTWLRHVFGAVLPGLDKILGHGASALVYLAAGFLGAGVWLILFLLVMLLKNILWAALIVAVVGLVVILVASQRKKAVK